MSGRRRRARELALQLLYQHDIARTEPAEMFARTDEYVSATPDVQEYASRLVLGTLARLPELDLGHRSLAIDAILVEVLREGLSKLGVIENANVLVV